MISPLPLAFVTKLGYTSLDLATALPQPSPVSVGTGMYTAQVGLSSHLPNGTHPAPTLYSIQTHLTSGEQSHSTDSPVGTQHV